MEVIFRIPTFIRWTCLCNSSIDGKTAYQENIDFTYNYVNKNDILPRVGEHVMFGENGLYLADTPMLVEDIIHKYDDNMLMYKDTMYVILEKKIIVVDYYKYMKAFTHCCDGLKDKKDVTFVPDYNDYEFIPPKSLEEWKNDVLTLRQLYYSTEDIMQYTDKGLIELSNSRCRKKSNK